MHETSQSRHQTVSKRIARHGELTCGHALVPRRQIDAARVRDPDHGDGKRDPEAGRLRDIRRHEIDPPAWRSRRYGDTLLMNDPILEPGDLDRSLRFALDVLTPLVEADATDWSATAGDLDWSRRRTLDHIIDTMLFLAGHAATRSDRRRSAVRNGDAGANIPSLLESLGTSVMILGAVCAGMDPDERGFHPAGRPDADGFRAQGCSEILLHTHDIAQGPALTMQPPGDLCDRVVRRLFPWALDTAARTADDPDPWQMLLWACGRIALPDRPRLAPDWWTHPAPLDEWDGTRKVRTSPPAWS